MKRNNVYSLEKYKLNKNNGFKAASVLKTIAWIALSIGSALFALNVSDFSQSNLGLMIGIGFLIAGMQIYGIGMVVHLLHSTNINSPRTDP